MAERAEHPDLSCLQRTCELADLLDHLLVQIVGARVQAGRVDLHRQQHLVVAGHLRALTDQLQVGVDQRRAVRRQLGVARRVQPPRQLVALCRRGAFDPLQPPDRSVCGARQHRAPLRQPPLLGVRVQQREGERTAGEHRREPASVTLGDGSERVAAIGHGDQLDVT